MIKDGLHAADLMNKTIDHAIENPDTVVDDCEVGICVMFVLCLLPSISVVHHAIQLRTVPHGQHYVRTVWGLQLEFTSTVVYALSAMSKRENQSELRSAGRAGAEASH